MLYSRLHALVAQLDRALDSGSKGRGFESSQARIGLEACNNRLVDIPPGGFLQVLIAEDSR